MQLEKQGTATVRSPFRGEGRASGADVANDRGPGDRGDRPVVLPMILTASGFEYLAVQRESDRSGSDRRAARHPIGAALSWIGAQFVEGFALTGAAMHPELFWQPEPEHGPEHKVVNDGPLLPSRQRQPAVDGPTERVGYPETARANRRRWNERAIALLEGLRSSVRRRRETSRMKTDWQSIDDRTLKDIGLTRHEVGLIVREGCPWD
jgi:hypothetical protein